RNRVQLSESSEGNSDRQEQHPAANWPGLGPVRGRQDGHPQLIWGLLRSSAARTVLPWRCFRRLHQRTAGLRGHGWLQRRRTAGESKCHPDISRPAFKYTGLRLRAVVKSQHPGGARILAKPAEVLLPYSRYRLWREFQFDFSSAELLKPFNLSATRLPAIRVSTGQELCVRLFTAGESFCRA